MTKCHRWAVRVWFAFCSSMFDEGWFAVRLELARRAATFTMG